MLGLLALFAITLQMLAEAAHDLRFPAPGHFAIDFVEREVHHVMMVELFWGDLVAKAQPMLMDQIHLVGG